MKSSFRSEWGSGRRLVTADMFNTAKRSMEETVKDPVSRGDEPPYDGCRVMLGKDFKYAFANLTNKKRGRSSASADDGHYHDVKK